MRLIFVGKMESVPVLGSASVMNSTEVLSAMRESKRLIFRVTRSLMSN